MATIYQNKKDGKIVSFKFKAFLGRNEKGKQIFKCKTWKCNQKIPESKLVALAEKEATIWEHELMKKNKDKKQKLLPVEIMFEDFVENMWFPNQMNTNEHRKVQNIFIAFDR
ncbi:MAG: hypothetical protein IIW02_04635 [Clostridia bacterium]|nr:hypothetical protein [Clostridia bacterium]